MANEATDEKKPAPPAANVVKLSTPAAGTPLLRRRGVTLPAALEIAPAVIAPAAVGRSLSQDAEYTSLRDVIGWPTPAGIASPTTPGAAGCGGGSGEIRIRNRLVQQAAHAYLQPTPSAASHRRRGLPLSCAELLAPCLHFLARLFRSFCGCLCRLG